MNILIVYSYPDMEEDKYSVLEIDCPMIQKRFTDLEGDSGWIDLTGSTVPFRRPIEQINSQNSTELVSYIDEKGISHMVIARERGFNTVLAEVTKL